MIFRIGLMLLLFLASHPLVAMDVIKSQVFVKEGVFLIDVQVKFRASPDTVFDALMDYDALHTYSKDIISSKKISSSNADQAMVFTHIRGCILFFCREIKKTEALFTLGKEKIVTQLVPERSSNVKHAKSTWILKKEKKQSLEDIQEQKQDTTILHFTSEFEPGFWVPKKSFGQRLLKDGIKILNQMEQKIQNRDKDR